MFYGSNLLDSVGVQVSWRMDYKPHTEVSWPWLVTRLERQGRSYVFAFDCSLPKKKPTSQLPFITLQSLFPAHLSSCSLKPPADIGSSPPFPHPSEILIIVHRHLKQPSYLCPAFQHYIPTSHLAQMLPPPWSPLPFCTAPCSSLPSGTCLLSFTQPALTVLQCSLLALAITFLTV